MKFNIPAEHKNASGVYIIRNTVNEKVYVGSARNFYKRYQGHHSHLGRSKHHSKHMQRHCDKYGLDCFTFNLLELIDDETNELLKVESRYIELFGAANATKGFNNMPASLPARHSETTKAKLKGLLAGYISPEVIERRSESIRKTAAKRTEARLAVRVACLNCQNDFWPKALGKRQPRFCSHECSTKYPVSEETRAKQRVSSTGRARSLESIEKGRQKQLGRGDLRSPEGKERQRIAAASRIQPEEEKAKHRARLASSEVAASRIAALKSKGAWNKSDEAERARSCQGCGSTFLVDWPKQVRVFCSRSCWQQNSRKEPPNKLAEAERWRDCQRCGKKFFARPSEKTKTCSKDCGYALRRATTLQKYSSASN